MATHYAGYETDPMRQYLEVLPMAIGLARGAADMAESYRGVHVGAVAVGVDSTYNEILFSDGWNTKPSEQAVKFCAEMRSILAAGYLDFGKIIGFVVAGTTDRETIESIAPFTTPTLRPCEPCQVVMSNSPLVAADTPILTVGRYVDVAELHTLAELRQQQKNGVPESINSDFLFTPGNWKPVVDTYDFLASSDLSPVLPSVEAARTALRQSVKQQKGSLVVDPRIS